MDWPYFRKEYKLYRPYIYTSRFVYNSKKYWYEVRIHFTQNSIAEKVNVPFRYSNCRFRVTTRRDLL